MQLPSVDKAKEAERADIKMRVDAYLKAGGKIYQAKEGESSNNFSTYIAQAKEFRINPKKAKESD